MESREVIDFCSVEKKVDHYKDQFRSGVTEYVVIDSLLHSEQADRILSEFPDPLKFGIRKSRDYIFAKNKYEKSDIASMGSGLSCLKDELLGARFQKLLCEITGERVFVDPSFHGGGLHQGGEGSYLNMHADFNYHPNHADWFRNLNILIYFNKDWQPEYGGQLKLMNKNTGEKAEIAPLFNRCVIMYTRDYTLHGYDPISFPPGEYRRSLAAYAYSIDSIGSADSKSTTWYPESGGVAKKLIGRCWPTLVAWKTRLMGSSTAKNR